MNKIPKVFTDNSITDFWDILNEMPTLDGTAVAQEILKLERYERNELEYMEFDDELEYKKYKDELQELIKGRINLLRQSLGAWFGAKQKLATEAISEKDYLIRIATSIYSSEKTFINAENHYATLISFIGLLYCFNISETNESHHRLIIKMADSQPLSKFIRAIPELNSGINFSRAMLDDIDTAKEHFEGENNIKSEIGHIYSFLYYLHIQEKINARMKLRFIKENYNMRAVDNAFRLCLAHKIITKNDLDEWSQLINK